MCQFFLLLLERSRWLGWCDSGDAPWWHWGAVTQGKLVRVAAIKLLTPAKLLFAKASYQLWLKLKEV